MHRWIWFNYHFFLSFFLSKTKFQLEENNCTLFCITRTQTILTVVTKPPAQKSFRLSFFGLPHRHLDRIVTFLGCREK